MLYSSLSYVLSKYLQSNDFVIADYIYLNVAETSSFGQYQEYLPFRIRIDSTLSLAHSSSKIHQDLKKAETIGNYSTKSIYDWIELSTDKELFEIGFRYESLHVQLSNSPCITVEVDPASFLPLLLCVKKQGRSIQIEYDISKVDESIADSILFHTLEILKQIPKCEFVEDLNFFTKEDQSEYIPLCGTKKDEARYSQCVHTQFEKIALDRPFDIALIDAKARATYHELNNQANFLADFLKKQSAHHLARIGVWAENSMFSIISLLGILKANYVYAPLNPDNPKERNEFICQDADIKIVLCRSKECDLQLDGVEIVYLDELFKNYSGVYKNPENTLAIDDDAYILYTSGSTGKPKGVINTHLGLCNIIHNMLDMFKPQPQERFLQLYSLTFDVSLQEIFCALLSGSVLIIRDKDIYDTLRGFNQKIYEYKIQYLHLVTAVWHK